MALAAEAASSSATSGAGAASASASASPGQTMVPMGSAGGVGGVDAVDEFAELRQQSTELREGDMNLSSHIKTPLHTNEHTLSYQYPLSYYLTHSN